MKVRGVWKPLATVKVANVANSFPSLCVAIAAPTSHKPSPSAFGFPINELRISEVVLILSLWKTNGSFLRCSQNLAKYVPKKLLDDSDFAIAASFPSVELLVQEDALPEIALLSKLDSRL